MCATRSHWNDEEQHNNNMNFKFEGPIVKKFHCYKYYFQINIVNILRGIES